jgi:anti-anti-sigma factor
LESERLKESGWEVTRLNEFHAAARQVKQPRAAATVIRGPCSQDVCVIYLDGSFCAPLPGELRHRVHTLLGQGTQTILLDLARVSRIDAAGIGQLVRAYNIARAAQRVLQITSARPWVRMALELVGLFDVLNAGGQDDELE